VTDADDIMQKFDADGSGNLDDKEMSAMKAYIQDKKDNLASQRMSASNQHSKVAFAHNTTSQNVQPVVDHINSDKAAASEGVGAAAHVGDFVSQMAFKNASSTY
jgi:hypothetical protein